MELLALSDALCEKLGIQKHISSSPTDSGYPKLYEPVNFVLLLEVVMRLVDFDNIDFRLGKGQDTFVHWLLLSLYDYLGCTQADYKESQDKICSEMRKVKWNTDNRKVIKLCQK